jgi:hypothetical protein
MPKLNQIATFGLMTALALLGSGCRRLSAQSEGAPPQERFAREFMRALQDSGSAAIVPRTAPKTRALKNFALNMDILRGELAKSHATLTLARWSVLPQKEGEPGVVLIVYRVQGDGEPSELKLWIEEESGRYLLNTIATGAPSPGGAA